MAFQDRTLEKLRAIPGVEAAALAGQIPFGGNYDCRGFHAKGRMKPNPEEDPCIERYGMTPGYRRLMGIPLLAGRTFTGADTATAQPVMVISSRRPGGVGDRQPARRAGAHRGPRDAARGARSSASSATCTTRT